MSKVRVEVNDNLANIFNFINSAVEPVTYMELIQFCIDYDLYKEFYINHAIIVRLFDEKMKALNDLKAKKGGSNEKKDLSIL